MSKARCYINPPVNAYVGCRQRQHAPLAVPVNRLCAALGQSLCDAARQTTAPRRAIQSIAAAASRAADDSNGDRHGANDDANKVAGGGISADCGITGQHHRLRAPADDGQARYRRRHAGTIYESVIVATLLTLLSRNPP